MSLAYIKESYFLFLCKSMRACVLIKWFVRVLKMSTVYGSITVIWLFFFLKLNCQKLKKNSCYNYTLGLVCNCRPSKDPCQGVLTTPVIAEGAHYSSEFTQ